MNPKFEKREINDSKMECDTEDELDIDVVGSDSETEEDQAISDAQKLQATLSRKQSILRRWEAENGHSTKTEASENSRDGSEAMEVENYPPMPLHPAFRERSKPNIGAKSINSDIFCTIEQIKNQAAAQRQLLSEQRAFLAPQPDGQPVMKLASRNDSAPNAVVQLKTPVSPTPDDQPAATNFENDESRPFKCNECGVGFRIAGHLTRHYKSRSHMSKTSPNRTTTPSPAASEASSSMRSSPSTTPSPAMSPPIAPEHQSGSRRFRCDVCDIGFRFQGHLDRHLRSTTHLSMEEAVRRNTKEK